MSYNLEYRITPLGLWKFEGEGTPLGALAWGQTGGSLGETASILILLGGAYLAWKRFLDWRVPAAVNPILIAVAMFAVLDRVTDQARRR